MDDTRQALVDEVLERMIHLEQERKLWLAGTPLEIREACAPLHGPLFASYHGDLDLRDNDFLSDLQGGFPLIGRMPELDYAVKSDIEPEDILSERDLQDARASNNRIILGKLKASDMDDEVYQMTCEDASKGWMSWPRRLRHADLADYALTRRLPVAEWREHVASYRTRIVDHATESLRNAATGTAGQRLQSDTLELLFWLLSIFMLAAVEPFLYKADVASAYRKVPIRPAHHQYSASVFSYAGDAWLSLHYVCAFGAVSSVWNFHRVGNWLLRFLRTKALLPVLKYVDDFFGVSRRGLRFAPTDVMSVIFCAFGLELDGRKSECFQSALVVLGAKVVVS